MYELRKRPRDDTLRQCERVSEKMLSKMRALTLALAARENSGVPGIDRAGEVRGCEVRGYDRANRVEGEVSGYDRATTFVKEDFNIVHPHEGGGEMAHGVGVCDSQRGAGCRGEARPGGSGVRDA